MMMKNLKFVLLLHFIAHILFVAPLTQINIYTFCGNKASFIAWHLHNNFLYKDEKEEVSSAMCYSCIANVIALVKCR